MDLPTRISTKIKVMAEIRRNIGVWKGTVWALRKVTQSSQFPQIGRIRFFQTHSKMCCHFFSGTAGAHLVWCLNCIVILKLIVWLWLSPLVSAKAFVLCLFAGVQKGIDVRMMGGAIDCFSRGEMRMQWRRVSVVRTVQALRILWYLTYGMQFAYGHVPVHFLQAGLAGFSTGLS